MRFKKIIQSFSDNYLTYNFIKSNSSIPMILISHYMVVSSLLFQLSNNYIFDLLNIIISQSSFYDFLDSFNLLLFFLAKLPSNLFITLLTKLLNCNDLDYHLKLNFTIKLVCILQFDSTLLFKNYYFFKNYHCLHKNSINSSKFFPSKYFILVDPVLSYFSDYLPFIKNSSDNNGYNDNIDDNPSLNSYNG